jgi:cytoskeleton protein RodZ
MAVDSDSLGSYLRQVRERQQVSLQDIAAATKIQLKFLEALENDAYERLPATPFVVGFLRAYAQYCAIDPKEVLTAYRSLHRTPEPPEVVLRPVTTPTPSPQRWPLVRLGVFLAVFGLIAGLVVHELRRGQQTRSTVASFPAVLPETPEDTAGATPPAAPATVAVPGGQTSPAGSSRPAQGPGLTTLGSSEAAALPPASPTPGTSKAGEARSTVGPGSLVLQARAVEDTWLRIEIDGSQPLTLLLTSGRSAQWEAQERFRLTVGNVQGTRLALNGQDIPLQSGRGNVMRDMLLTRALLR